ncbi:SIR2-like domain-containing protein [Desulfotomaculum arcticum]|uniref:SIR2-like domain-containing protein n=2 Tax=Desulfotruncus TaxID=2867377 RepID=A0A1I2U4D1_9FIRM|nr:SIR2-like domain-containing protein [Desulfotomaculum arcticum] [Desulfotruncus arcticus DSM 17038]
MIDREQMIKKYVEVLRCGRAALFLGAGLSKPVGFFDWKELLREPAKELGLNVDKEHDLIGLAQMYVLRKGNRGGLTQEILNHFGKDVTGTESHRIITRLPLSNIWTTNYDLVIEETFRQEGISVNVVRDDDALAYSNVNAPVTIYKMHGDVSQLNGIVLTRDDYEFYDTRRSAMSSAFYCALVEHTFLFLGFSFNDPNLQKVFGRIRAIFRENSREHFTIMRRPQPGDDDYQYEKNKFELFVDDLKRYNIQTVAVDDYGGIADILGSIEKEYYKKNIYVTGLGGDNTACGRNFYHFLRRLGKYTIVEGYNLTCGFDSIIDTHVLAGAMEQLYKSGKSIEFFARFNLVPCIGNSPDLLLKYKEDMIKRSGCCIFTGNCNPQVGGEMLMKEYQIASKLGKLIIPVSAGHGGVIKDIWNLERDRYKKFNQNAQKAYQVLADAEKNNAEIIQAVFTITSLEI